MSPAGPSVGPRRSNSVPRRTGRGKTPKAAAHVRSPSQRLAPASATSRSAGSLSGFVPGLKSVAQSPFGLRCTFSHLGCWPFRICSALLCVRVEYFLLVFIFSVCSALVRIPRVFASLRLSFLSVRAEFWRVFRVLWVLWIFIWFCWVRRQKF